MFWFACIFNSVIQPNLNICAAFLCQAVEIGKGAGAGAGSGAEIDSAAFSVVAPLLSCCFSFSSSALVLSNSWHLF